MDHSKVRKLLSAYLDGELSRAQADAVEQHISRCSECAEHLEALRRLDGSVQSAKAGMPAEGYFEFFPSKLMARIRSEKRTVLPADRLRVRLVKVRAGATALVVLMAFGMGVLYGQRGVPTRTPRLTPIPLITTSPRDRTYAYDEVSFSGEAKKERVEPPAAVVGEMASPAEVMERSVAADEEPGPPTEERTALGGHAQPAYVPAPAAEREEIVSEGVQAEKSTLARSMDKGEEVDPLRVYTTANLAQLKQDYDGALDGYGKVIKLSPGTELASAAQYQMNVVRAAADTGAGLERLRWNAQMWDDYIHQYPGSAYILSACGEYTEALYQIARKTKSKTDAEKALNAIDNCQALIREKMPSPAQEKTEELKGYLEH